MVGVLRVGCAMWTNKAWPGRSIPLPTPSGGELAAYASLVSAVEGNTTFYALPQRATAARWAESVPDNFRFMFKFPRSVTHERKLRDCSKTVHEFFDVLEPCLPNMEPMAIQLPASFGPESLNVLEQFLAGAPSVVRYAVEVRHLDFFDGGDTERRLNDMLFARGADRIILDSRAVFAGPRVTPAEHDAFENKPRLPARAVATNDRPVVRFIGQTASEANAAFWKPWVDTAVRWLNDDRSPLVFIHTPDNADALTLARQFYDEVRAQMPELAPQPDAPPVDAPALFD
jgi:uncharacterized protein YecE (DUF72 family)